MIRTNAAALSLRCVGFVQFRSVSRNDGQPPGKGHVYPGREHEWANGPWEQDRDLLGTHILIYPPPGIKAYLETPAVFEGSPGALGALCETERHREVEVRADSGPRRVGQGGQCLDNPFQNETVWFKLRP